MRFIENQPPFRLYDQEQFNALLEIENRGATILGKPADRIYLSGFDHRIITGIPFTGEAMPKIEGKTIEQPTTINTDFVEFKGYIDKLTISKYPVKLVATACYIYESIAEGTLCIDPDPFGRTTLRKACTPSNIGLGTQGAPISINLIEVEPRKGKTLLRVHVSNVGGGIVFQENAVNRCSPYADQILSYNEIDLVNVVDVKIGITSIKLSCKGLAQNNFIRLTGNKGSFTCEYDTSTEPAGGVVVPISVVLRYGYRQSISKNIEILQTPS